jgi:tRNA A37 methylthiotransferase MiaB
MRDYDTHVIIGFPGETDADVDETLSLLLQIHPRYVLLSTYMESPAAPAARLTGKIGRHVAAKRSAYIEEALQKAGILCNSDGNSLSQGRLSTLFG